MDNSFLEKLEKFKLPLALSLIGLVLIIGGIIVSGLTKKSKDFPKESLVESRKMISVDVSGAVNRPGVYQLKDGDRIEEAIKQAGGFAENANAEYIAKYLNMAQRLIDGTKIYVPAEGDPVPVGAGQAGMAAGVTSTTKVNINTASQSELEALPGIGPATASKIISDRPYQDLSELLSKKVVGKAVYEKIKDSLVVY